MSFVRSKSVTDASVADHAGTQNGRFVLDRRVLEYGMTAVGVAAWGFVVLRTLALYNIISQGQSIIWLYDWHVHSAGARQVVEGNLYEAGLRMPGWPIPVDVFNLPPASAYIAVPLLALPDAVAGPLWLAFGWAALMGAFLLLARVLALPYWWVAAGVGAMIYSLLEWYGAHLTLGNINHLMLFLLVAFSWAMTRNRHLLSGALLGTAIALKAWPVAVLPLMVRERRWTELSVAIAIPSASLFVLAATSGLDGVVSMIQGMRTQVPIEPGQAVLWTTWVREELGATPAIGPIAAAVLLAIPASGLLGLGIALIAGVSLVANIWDHYLATLLVGVILAAWGLHPLLSAAGWRTRDQVLAAGLVILTVTAVARQTP